MKAGRQFEQYLAWAECGPCLLPYHFGGATQCGRLNDHNNNQDAIALWSDGDVIAGVVCDGCSSVPNGGGYSNNEVGARLLAMVTANMLEANVTEFGVNKLCEQLASFEGELCERLEQMVGVIDGTVQQRERVLATFFMTTILAFVIDRKNFAILGCGDGLYSVNGKVEFLHSEEGCYLAGRLLSKNDWKARLERGDGSLKLHATGDTHSLRSLFIASDGFESLAERFPNHLRDLLSAHQLEKLGTGYCGRIGEEFRRRFWQLPDVDQWSETQDAYDDRSFLLLRYVDEAASAKEESSSQPTLQGTSFDAANQP